MANKEPGKEPKTKRLRNFVLVVVGALLLLCVVASAAGFITNQ
jgi:hypothetical protein